ncbi:MAG: hypothetical protein ACM37W_21225 [Actinomycetota bacterium]
MRKLAIAALALIAIAFPQSAIAVNVAKDDAGNLIVTDSGLAPGSLVKIPYQGIPVSKTFTPTGACQIITLTSTDRFKFIEYVKVGTTQINWTALQQPETIATPCVSGAINPALPWVTVGSYKAVLSPSKANTILVAGVTAPTVVTTDWWKVRLSKVDACGRISIRNSTTWPVDKIASGGMFYFWDNGGNPSADIPLPSSSTPLPICRKGILYRPL